MRLDTGRFVVWSEPGPPPDIDFSGRDYTRAHRAGGPETFIGEVVRAQPMGTLGFTISRRSPDNRAVAVSLIEVASLQAFHASVRQSEDDVLALIREDSSILVRTPPMPDPVGARLPPTALFSSYLQGQIAGTVRTASALDGVERIYRFRHVAPYPVHVAYGYDMGSVRREFRDRMLPNLLTTGLACAILVLLSPMPRAPWPSGSRRISPRRGRGSRLSRSAAAAELGARLEIALDGAGLAPFERDLTTGEGHWSERIRALYGVGPELERNSVEDWMRIIHPDDRARVAADLRSAAEGQPHNTDYRIILPSGDVRWIASRGNLQYDADGKAARAVGVCFDITSRKEAETRLADEGRSLRLGQELAGLGPRHGRLRDRQADPRRHRCPSVRPAGTALAAAPVAPRPSASGRPRRSRSGAERITRAGRRRPTRRRGAHPAGGRPHALDRGAAADRVRHRRRWRADPREAPSSWCATSPNVAAARSASPS